MRLSALFFIFLSAFFFLNPQIASAHAFGQLYNLPVPFWMYLYGGAAAIILSFLIIGYFVSNTATKDFYPSRVIPQLSFLTKPLFLKMIKGISVFLFLFTILAGLIGEDISSINFNMIFFWIIFSLGLTYFVAIFGNVWTVINPFKVLAEWTEKILGSPIQGVIKYPQALGYYPALLFYFLFIWIELLGDTSPFTLSLILIQYTFFNVVGVMAFGKKDWFTYAEFFSVFFTLFGKMGIFETEKSRLYIRPPFLGLLKGSAEHFSLLLFILFMLSSTAYDGFRSTTTWVRFYYDAIDPILSPLLGTHAFQIFQTLGLLCSPLFFLVIYIALVYSAKVITKTKLSLLELLEQFAFSLIPIAFAYNVAHYYTLLITEGQNMLRILSDPLGYGWNLFGTRGDFDIYIPDANFIWHSQVGIILLGHIVGVYLAHIVALRLFPNHKKALLSQIPLLILMVIYTMAGLWILSQPITAE